MSVSIHPAAILLIRRVAFFVKPRFRKLRESLVEFAATLVILGGGSEAVFQP
jgi:hypothetical protein